ncbi:MAG: DNA (cytosine-5-)-methyltransferase [Candidatus Brocadiales bacterium]|nr:DNA (cytosine-5-)-methyltransferase [Candidatus Brocadiales bacterium]
MKKKVLSLFSGCGGMDIGLEGDFWVFSKSIKDKNLVAKKDGQQVLLKESLFETVFANDILKPAKTAWGNYFGQKGKSNDVYHLESIVDLIKQHRNGVYDFPSNIDVVTGGFPCQDFSVAGNRKGFNSDKSHTGDKLGEEIDLEENRGKLYAWMREVIRITKPKVFIAENVKGLATLENIRETIENDFRDIGNGYIVFSKILHSGEYGVPQKRERIIFLGFNKDCLKEEALEQLSSHNPSEEYNPYPPKTHRIYKTQPQINMFEDSEDLLPQVTTGDVLKDVNEPDIEKIDSSQKSFSKAKFIKNYQGNVEININGLGPTIRAEHHGNIEFRRLSKENGGKNLDELNKGLEQRRLTVRECARIQTFPDNYPFVVQHKHRDPKNVSASAAYKVIGNAVPPLLAYSIGMNLQKKWDSYFK